MEKEVLKLFPYQELGGFWLSERSHAILGDEMGLGKSAQAIYAVDLLKLKRVIILCPAVARINWIREFQKFSVIPRNFITIESKTIPPIQSHQSIICSYDLAHDLNEYLNTSSNTLTISNPTPTLKAHPFDALILDEFHYLKSIKTKRTAAVYGKNGLIRKTKRCYALSGTPAPNHPGELWPTLYTFGVTPHSYDAFVERYCSYYYLPKKRAICITGAKNEMLPELSRTINKIMLRRRKDEVMKDLPPIYFSDIVVPPGKVDLHVESSFIQYVYPHDKTKELEAKLEAERKLLSDLVTKTGFTMDGMKTLEAISKSISTLRRYTGLQKVQAVADLVTEELTAKAYEKIVIFAIHRDVIENLRIKLSKFKPVTLYGGTPPQTRQKNIDKFQKTDRCRVFIGNIQAAGTAITLTAAHNILFIEQDWVPGNNAQAAMRCHRIGQTKPVYVRCAGLANSIDEKITQVIRIKARQLLVLFDQNNESPLQSEFSSVSSNGVAENKNNSQSIIGFDELDNEGIFS